MIDWSGWIVHDSYDDARPLAANRGAISRGADARRARPPRVSRTRVRRRRYLQKEVESLLDAAGLRSWLSRQSRGDRRRADGQRRHVSVLVGPPLGAYQVQARLGAGGMGEVYRARDTKLGRDVAIKILPRAFTSDPERLARFEREARMLAALNHPNIGAIYGLEDADGMPALVLELVDGETLADRIARGPLP